MVSTAKHGGSKSEIRERPPWSEAIGVGSLTFAEKIKSDFGTKGIHREVEQADRMYVLRESSDAYNGEFAQKTEALRPENTIPWQKFTDTAETYRDPTRGMEPAARDILLCDIQLITTTKTNVGFGAA
jgi:hypothetical protein